MSNIHPFPRRDERYDEASRWIAMLDRGISAEEAEALRAWMSASPENSAVLESMARVWDKMDTLARLSDLFPASARRRRWMPPVLGLAASVLVAALVGVWFEALGPGAGPLANFDGLYETAVGEKSTVTLSDGTLVVLNTNSLLHVEYTPAYRLLTLDRGEVNVRVAKDESRPLTVAAANQLFEAVGTAFNVEIVDEQRIELVVTEGKVRVGVREPRTQTRPRAKPEVALQTLRSTRTVSAGEGLILGAGTAIDAVIPVTPEEIEVKLSWRNGNLIFTGEPLEVALQEVERYTSVKFVFLDDAVRTRTVAGLYKAGDVDGLLTSLQENLDIDYERVDEKTVLLDSQ